MELAERGSLLKLLRRRRGMSTTIRNQLNQLNTATLVLPQSTRGSRAEDGLRSPQLASPQDDVSSTTTTSTQVNSLPSCDLASPSPSQPSGHTLDTTSAMLLKMKQRSVLTQPEDMLRPRDIYKFARQIAKGMEFLESQRVSYSEDNVCPCTFSLWPYMHMPL